MKKIFNIFPAFFLVFVVGCTSNSIHPWNLVQNHLVSKWSKDVNPENPWPEYPRPQMERDTWLSLNGLWDYTILSDSKEVMIEKGQILVPYPIESALSGVGKRVNINEQLIYSRSIQIPEDWNEKRILIHFEAVDWKCQVSIDNKDIGSHTGGYDPFSFDITAFVIPGKKHEIKVVVLDPTSDGYQPRGKQVNEPRGIWYTPSTGIWQSVWLEPVAKSYICDLKITPDVDLQRVIIEPQVFSTEKEDKIKIEIKDGTNTVFEGQFEINKPIKVNIENPKLWAPETPHLYNLELSLLRNEVVIDEVKSYFGMRKISLVKDENGYNRLALNNEILFQNGPLDQGFWPDGIYTPPTDEAMKYDIEVTKQMGFNMLRKHVKVENRRFYTWCDKLGILVWQDMPSASGYVAPGGEDLNPSTEHKTNFENELTQLIKTHFNHPSIVIWVPFNEGWGQYDTKRIVELVETLDSTRLVNNASGWEDRGIGDVLDIHHYPDPSCPEKQEERASVLGEFGGIGYFVEGHTWQKENWGYEKMQNLDDLLMKYEDYYQEIFRLQREKGLAACVYTQTTDVETETNGLLTYDRALVKMGIDNIRKAHEGILPPRLKSPFRSFIDTFIIELNCADQNAKIYFTLDGSNPDENAASYSKPIIINKTSTLKTIAIYPSGEKSRINSYTLEQVEPQSVPEQPDEILEGLQVFYYEGNWDSIPDFGSLQILSEGVSPKVDLSFTESKELFGLVFEGYLDVPETGVFNIYLSCDDGGRIILDGKTFIDYDGIHGMGIRKSSVALEKGLHPFRFIYFQRYGGLGINISWEGSGLDYQEISADYWKH